MNRAIIQEQMRTASIARRLLFTTFTIIVRLGPITFIRGMSVGTVLILHFFRRGLSSPFTNGTIRRHQWFSIVNFGLR